MFEFDSSSDEDDHDDEEDMKDQDYVAQDDDYESCRSTHFRERGGCDAVAVETEGRQDGHGLRNSVRGQGGVEVPLGGRKLRRTAERRSRAALVRRRGARVRGEETQEGAVEPHMRGSSERPRDVRVVGPKKPCLKRHEARARVRGSRQKVKQVRFES